MFDIGYDPTTTGEIPEALANWTSIETVQVFETNITGISPTLLPGGKIFFIFRLALTESVLRYRASGHRVFMDLDFSNNQFYGNISLGFPGLRNVDLSFNLLTGSTPNMTAPNAILSLGRPAATQAFKHRAGQLVGLRNRGANTLETISRARYADRGPKIPRLTAV